MGQAGRAGRWDQGGWWPDQRGAAGAGRAAAGEPPAAGGRGHPPAGGGFLRVNAMIVTARQGSLISLLPRSDGWWLVLDVRSCRAPGARRRRGLIGACLVLD